MEMLDARRLDLQPGCMRLLEAAAKALEKIRGHVAEAAIQLESSQSVAAVVAKSSLPIEQQVAAPELREVMKASLAVEQEERMVNPTSPLAAEEVQLAVEWKRSAALEALLVRPEKLPEAVATHLDLKVLQLVAVEGQLESPG